MVQAVPVAPVASAKVVRVVGEWETLDLVMDRSAQERGSVLDPQP